MLTATAKKYGLCCRASRSICFGQPEPLFRKEHDSACKVSATYVASTWPGLDAAADSHERSADLRTHRRGI